MVIAKGAVVRSLTGRDKGGLLVVVAVCADGFFVCDGKERPVERPKRKNPRHIAPTPYSLDEAAYQYNRPLRRALRKLDGEKIGQT